MEGIVRIAVDIFLMKKHVIMYMESVLKNANLGTKLHTALKVMTIVRIYCHHVNGTCMNGCASGYRGFKCTDGLLFYIEVDLIDSLQSYVWCLK